MAEPGAAPGVTRPLSSAMIAILSMAAQYFFLYTVMAMLRTAQALGAVDSSKVTPTMIAATATVNFVPMISIAILAVRVRAVFLTTTPQNGGRPDDFDMPPQYAKYGFSMCSFSILTQLALILLYPVITGKSIDPRKDIDSDGNLLQEPEQGSVVGSIIKAVRNVAFLALYAGQTMICYCLLTMEAPDAIVKANAWSGQPPLPASVHAVIQLIILYFLVYLVIAVVREYFPSKRVLLGVMNLCAWSVTMAPMLSVLFMGARLRELQIRGSGTAGDDYAMASWAQICFHLCWASLYVQCLLIVAVVFLKGDVEQGDFYGDVRFIMTNLTVFMWLHVVRWVAQLALYGGLLGVVYGIVSMEHPLGPDHTPKLSPAMECTLSLTAQFFFVYVGIFVVASLRQFLNSSFTLTMQTFSAAQAVVMFCPMLCVLFMGARSRALEITGQKGAPQGWVQQCMEAATYATLFQLILCMFLPCVMGREVESDQDGNIKADKASVGKFGFIVLESLRYMCMIAMYGGALGVVCGMFLMNIENCNGEGMLPLLGHVIPRLTSPLTAKVEMPGLPELPIAAAAPAPAI